MGFLAAQDTNEGALLNSLDIVKLTKAAHHVSKRALSEQKQNTNNLLAACAACDEQFDKGVPRGSHLYPATNRFSHRPAAARSTLPPDKMMPTF